MLNDNMGWICPVCRTVYAPSKLQCGQCVPAQVKTKGFTDACANDMSPFRVKLPVLFLDDRYTESDIQTLRAFIEQYEPAFLIETIRDGIQFREPHTPDRSLSSPRERCLTPDE